MTNEHWRSQPNQQRRYSVSQLLELAPQTHILNFDLSKFTFDAARAGVVPPLGACAMPARRASGDPPRNSNWSQDSASSEDCVVYQGNRVTQLPARQPVTAPAEPRAQQDEGFARFLKKHSSPTHQRVTAGGRIVPMEHRVHPPAFSLPISKNATSTDDKEIRKEEAQLDAVAATSGSKGLGEQKAGGANNSAVRPALKDTTESTDKSLVTPCHSDIILQNNEAYGLESLPAPAVGYIPTAPLYPGGMMEPYSPPLVPYGNYAISPGLPAYSPGLGLGIAIPGTWPYTDMYGFNVTETNLQAALDSPTQHQMYCQNALHQANALFEDLGRQLRSLDRHHSLHNIRGQPHGDQRMVLAQQRADAKRMVTFWKQQLGLDLQIIQSHSTIRPNPPLNVQAAAYVPKAAAIGQVDMSATLSNAPVSREKPLMSNMNEPFKLQRPERRVIPIVAPKLPTPPCDEPKPTKIPTPPPKYEVDEWGSRIGPRPPELERQQTQQLAKLLAEQAKAAGSPTSGRLISTAPANGSQTSLLSTKTLDSVHKNDGDNGDAQHSSPAEYSSLSPKKGQAPPEVQAGYVLMLDAMRQPKGTICKIRLHDGSIQEIRGIDLQRPPSGGMDAFERNYWNMKPVVTEDMKQGFVECRTESTDEALKRVAEFANRRLQSIDNLGTEVAKCTLSNKSSGSMKNQQSQGMRDSDVVNVHESFRGRGTREYNSEVIPWSGSESSLAHLKHSTASTSRIWTQADEPSTWGTNIGRDPYSNKGYSSVSMQPVHAVAVPNMLDGTAENRRSARMMLSVAKNGRNPRVIHRVGPTGSEWLGPYSRDLHGPGHEEVEEEVFQAKA